MLAVFLGRHDLKLPPTIDAVPVIRCKDCKHYTGYECIRAKVSNIRVITDENEYCSRAERKEE
jgi:hypothetical protein